jgi:hypothetical protein
MIFFEVFLGLNLGNLCIAGFCEDVLLVNQFVIVNTELVDALGGVSKRQGWFFEFSLKFYNYSARSHAP